MDRRKFLGLGTAFLAASYLGLRQKDRVLQRGGHAVEAGKLYFVSDDDKAFIHAVAKEVLERFYEVGIGFEDVRIVDSFPQIEITDTVLADISKHKGVCAHFEESGYFGITEEQARSLPVGDVLLGNTAVICMEKRINLYSRDGLSIENKFLLNVNAYAHELGHALGAAHVFHRLPRVKLSDLPLIGKPSESYIMGAPGYNNVGFHPDNGEKMRNFALEYRSFGLEKITEERAQLHQRIIAVS